MRSREIRNPIVIHLVPSLGPANVLICRKRRGELAECSLLAGCQNRDMAGWRRDRAVRARYDEVVDIYGWLGDFTDTLDPDRDEDLLTDLFYVDSMVAGWISRGQFEKPGVREFVVKAIAQEDSNRAAHSTPPPDELWPRLQRLRELART